MMKNYLYNSKYKKFKNKSPHELKNLKKKHQVVIVGTGPIGLTLALELKRQGIEPVIITRNDRIPEGSKAICISRESMEIFQSLNAADEIEKVGLGWTNGNSFYKDKKVFELKMPGSKNEKYKPMTNLQQSILEEILLNECINNKIDVRWENIFIKIIENKNLVLLEVNSPYGKYQIQTEFLLAADGAKSKVRENLNLKFSGESFTGNYLISDIKIKLDFPTERLAFFYPTSNPNGTVLMHKQPFNIWRIDYQLENEFKNKLNITDVKNKIQKQLDSLKIKNKWELVWWSTYQAHCLTLDNFVHNRVIFCGDAAHLVPIFGVKGLNSGIADANNIGWKLSSVLNNTQPLSFLKSYNSERRTAILNIFKDSKKSTIFMTPPTNGYQLMQKAVLSLSINKKFSRSLINPRQSKADNYELKHNNINDNLFSKLKVGSRLKNIKIKNGYLFDQLPNSFFILSKNNLIINSSIPIIKINNKLYGKYIYLVRPDKYIVYVWDKLTLNEFEKILKKETGLKIVKKYN